MKKQKKFFNVDDIFLVGEVYFPADVKKPSPALCLCHGIPAADHDPADRGYPAMAERFCAAGFVTLIFNFRGTGQSQGNLDMRGWTRDLRTVIDFLTSLDEVDRSRLCLLGSSAGAAVSVYVAANDPRVSSLVTFACPAEFGFLSAGKQAMSPLDRFRSVGLIRDPDFPYSLDAWLEGFSMTSPIRWIDKISPRPLLLIHGDKDEVVAVEHAYRLYKQAGEPKEIVTIPEAGHRLRLEEKAITTALNWLKTGLTN